MARRDQWRGEADGSVRHRPLHEDGITNPYHGVAICYVDCLFECFLLWCQRVEVDATRRRGRHHCRLAGATRNVTYPVRVPRALCDG